MVALDEYRREMNRRSPVYLTMVLDLIDMGVLDDEQAKAMTTMGGIVSYRNRRRDAPKPMMEEPQEGKAYVKRLRKGE